MTDLGAHVTHVLEDQPSQESYETGFRTAVLDRRFLIILYALAL